MPDILFSSSGRLLFESQCVISVPILFWKTDFQGSLKEATYLLTIKEYERVYTIVFIPINPKYLSPYWFEDFFSLYGNWSVGPGVFDYSHVTIHRNKGLK